MPGCLCIYLLKLAVFYGVPLNNIIINGFEAQWPQVLELPTAGGHKMSSRPTTLLVR